MNRRTVYVAAALVTGAIAGAMLVDPGLAGAMGGHTIILIVLGLVMLFVGYGRYHLARKRERPVTTMEDPERRPPMVTPGATLDERWDEYRLTALAIAVLRRTRGCREAKAKQLLNSGAWTDDAEAAAYFSTEVAAPRGLLDRLRPRRRRRRQRERAVDQLARQLGVAEDARR